MCAASAITSSGGDQLLVQTDLEDALKGHK